MGWRELLVLLFALIAITILTIILINSIIEEGKIKERDYFEYSRKEREKEKEKETNK